MALLPRISSPADVRALRPAELVRLAAEIRHFLVQSVSRTGGHLGPNLGVVELTLAVHRVFESPRDTIVFDTGHQAYVHKLITGRSDFSGLRQRGGLSGYPNRSESEHDVVENSHGSTALSWGKRTRRHAGRLGRLIYGALHGMKKGIKDVVAPQGMFEDLGLKYIGPVDGHDVPTVERALRLARDFGGPVIVHVITEKGRGYVPAEQDDADRFHAVGRIHPETGLPVAASRFAWTSVFADEIVQVGHVRPDVVAITAAMLQPVGLAPFAAAFPSRVFDVGIAEQHAVTSAAGMAFAGLHPVVAVYATFLNRAFDQVLMDVALHKAGVTFVLDRAGITGDDGPSHNGMWDMALLRVVPGLHLAAPRDEETLRSALRTAVDIDDAPSVIRFPKGPLPGPLPAIDTLEGVDCRERTGQGALGEPDHARGVVDVDGRPQRAAQGLLVARGRQVQPGDHPEQRHVPHAVVAGTVVAGDPRTVQD